MINFICGKKGSGKTKRLISMANDHVNSSRGEIVFIEAKRKHTLDLNHKIRHISAMDFNMKTIENFHGFLCGIIAENYDVETIYVDGLYKIVQLDFYQLKKLINAMEELVYEYNIDFIITMECLEEDVPKELEKYLIEDKIKARA